MGSRTQYHQTSPSFLIHHTLFSSLLRKALVDLDQCWAERSSGSNIGSRVKLHISARGESPDGQTPRETLIVRERSEEVALATLGVDIGDGHRNRQVLAGDINHGRVRGTDCTLNAEKLSAVHGLGHSLDSESRESGQANDIDIGTGVWDDELAYSSVYELRGTSSQERSGGSDLLLQETVVACLFAFLGDDGANNRDQCTLVTAIGGKEALSDGENPEYDFREGLGECNGVVEVVYWEGVFTGLDGFVVGVREDTVCGECVNLFLL